MQTTVAAVLAVIATSITLSEWLYVSIAKMTWPFLRKHRNNQIGPMLNALGDDLFSGWLQPHCAQQSDAARPPQLHFDADTGIATCASVSRSIVIHFTEDADTWLRSQGYLRTLNNAIRTNLHDLN